MLTTDYMAGYVLIDVGHGDVQRVVERLLQHPNVHRAHALLGPNDIIAYLECHDSDELMRVVDDQIRALPEVVRTDTRLVLMRHARRTSG